MPVSGRGRDRSAPPDSHGAWCNNVRIVKADNTCALGVRRCGDCNWLTNYSCVRMCTCVGTSTSLVDTIRSHGYAASERNVVVFGNFGVPGESS